MQKLHYILWCNYIFWTCSCSVLHHSNQTKKLSRAWQISPSHLSSPFKVLKTGQEDTAENKLPLAVEHTIKSDLLFSTFRFCNPDDWQSPLPIYFGSTLNTGSAYQSNSLAYRWHFSSSPGWECSGKEHWWMRLMPATTWVPASGSKNCEAQ